MGMSKFYARPSVNRGLTPRMPMRTPCVRPWNPAYLNDPRRIKIRQPMDERLMYFGKLLYL